MATRCSLARWSGSASDAARSKDAGRLIATAASEKLESKNEWRKLARCRTYPLLQPSAAASVPWNTQPATETSLVYVRSRQGIGGA